MTRDAGSEVLRFLPTDNIRRAVRRVLVLAIYAAGAAALRRPDWFVRPGVAGCAVMLIVGLAIGVTVEWWGLHLARPWAYAESMPRLTGLRIGAVPVVQMLVLPPICFRLVTKLI